MSIKTRHTSKYKIPHFSINNRVMFPTTGVGANCVDTEGFDADFNSEFIVMRTKPDGQILDSNVILDPADYKPIKIDEIVQSMDCDMFVKHIQRSLDIKNVSSLKLTEVEGSNRAAHFVPIAENEVLVIIGRCLAVENQLKRLDANLKAMIHMLEFLPGKTIIADADHRLLNLKQEKKHQISSLEEINQIGAAIGCAHFQEGLGDCGTFPVCNKCTLQAAIQKVAAQEKNIRKQSIRLPIKVNNQLQFTDFTLSVSQALVDEKKHFVIYLEDSNNEKVKIKALQDSNKLLRNVLDSLPFSVHWKNLNSTFLGGNLKFIEDNKIKNQNDIFGQRDDQLYSRETARKNRQQDEITLKIEKPLWNCESNRLNAQSRKNNFISILKDSSGSKIGLVSTSINLAQQNWHQIHGNDSKVTQDVKFSEVDFIGVFDWLLKIDLLKGETQFQKLAGLKNQSVFLEDFCSNIEGEKCQKFIDTKRQIENQEEYRFLFTVRYSHPQSKTLRWFEISGQKIYKDLYGKAIKVTCTLKDVTDTKQKKIDQQKELAFHNAFLNSTKDAVWSIDNNYKITILNQSFRATYLMAFGIELDIGSCCLEGLEKTTKSRWIKRYDKALSGSAFKVVDQFDYEGLQQVAETILSPVTIDEKIIGVSCFSREISKRSIK